MSSVIYDISPMIKMNSLVWPQDTIPKKLKLLDMEDGDHMTLSALYTTVHLGAHADAPSHFIKGGKSIGEICLSSYVGLCQVIKVHKTQQIDPSHLLDDIRAPRVLLITDTFDQKIWNENFAYLSVELIDFLAKKGVLLIGIDTPSVDHFHSKDFQAHRRCFHHSISILEQLALTHIQTGLYELIALPLKLHGFEASPVRAILRKENK